MRHSLRKLSWGLYEPPRKSKDNEGFWVGIFEWIFIRNGDMSDDCLICKKEFEGYDPKMCCNGFECGCMGMPTEPAICSEKCWDKLMGKVRDNER